MSAIFHFRKNTVLFIIQFSYFVVEECSRFHLIYCYCDSFRPCFTYS